MDEGSKASHFITAEAGQTLIELALAIAIFSIVAATFLGIIISSLTLLGREQEIIGAQNLANEAIEAVYTLKDESWNKMTYGRSAVNLDDNHWTWAGENTTAQIGRYTRLIDFYPVYRNDNKDIVAEASSGSYLDVFSKNMTVTVSWPIGMGRNYEITRHALVTNWRSSVWPNTDWSGGSGQPIWSSENKFDSDDGNMLTASSGQISLLGSATSSYLYSSAYDTGTSSHFAGISWSHLLPSACAECTVGIQIKTAADNENAPGDWSPTWCGPTGEDGNEDDYFTANRGELIDASHDHDQWIKYRVRMVGSGSDTPVLHEIRIYYDQ